MDAMSMERMLQILEGGRGTLEIVKSSAASLREAEEKRGGKRYPESVSEMNRAEAGEAMSIYDLFESSVDEPPSPKRSDARRSLADQTRLSIRNEPPMIAESEAVSLNGGLREARSPSQVSTPPPHTITVISRKRLPSPLSPMPPGAQPQPPADRNLVQEPVFEDSPWLLKGRDNIRSNLESILSNLNSPGIVIGIISNGTREVYVAGVRKLGNKTPIAQTDRFSISD